MFVDSGRSVRDRTTLQISGYSTGPSGTSSNESRALVKVDEELLAISVFVS